MPVSYATFAKKAESLVKPRDVTAISFLGDFNKVLPLKVQHKMMTGGSAKAPYMGFIVDPYCCFVTYAVKDRDAAQRLLPDGYELAPARLFKDQAPVPLAIVGAFAIRTSAFIGNRLEVYLTARHVKSGALSWIIVAYETNTNSYDPKNGFCGYSADPAVLTTTPYGELVVDFARKGGGPAFACSMGLEKGRFRDLDPELWIEGNTSIDYGRELGSGTSEPFGLIFDPYLMKQALEIPREALVVERQTFLAGVIDPAEIHGALVFPYSQHFIIQQNAPAGASTSEDALRRRVDETVALGTLRTMEGDDIKRPLFRGLVVSAVVTWGLLFGLLAKVWLG